MTNLTVTPTEYNKGILFPPSPFHTIRLIFLAAIYPGTIIIQNYAKTPEIYHLLDLLQLIGINITRSDEGIIFHTSFPQSEQFHNKKDDIIIEINNLDQTFPFFIGLLAKGKATYHLKTAIKSSPEYLEYFNLLKEISNIYLEVSNENLLSLKIRGPLLPPKDYSQQKINTPHHKEVLDIVFSDYPSLIRNDNAPILEGSQLATKNLISTFYFEQAQGNISFFLPVDHDYLPYAISLASLKGHLVIPNCPFIDMMQDASFIFPILRKIHSNYVISKEGLVIPKSHQITGCFANLSKTPHFIPALSFLLSYASSESTIKGINLLENQKRDELFQLFDLFEVNYSYLRDSDELLLTGRTPPSGPKDFTVPLDNPHLGMTAYLFMKYNNGGRLSQIQEITKYYSYYFTLLE